MGAAFKYGLRCLSSFGRMVRCIPGCGNHMTKGIDMKMHGACQRHKEGRWDMTLGRQTGLASECSCRLS